MRPLGARLIKYVLSRGEMPYAKLMKVLFLIDRHLYLRHGYTVFAWRLYKYGPFSSQVLDALSELEAEGRVEARVERRGDGYSVAYRLEPQAAPELPPEVKEAADRALAQWADKELGELIKHVYGLEEVREARPGALLLRDLEREAAILIGLGAAAEEAYRREEEPMPIFKRIAELRQRVLDDALGGEARADEISAAVSEALRRYTPYVEEAIKEIIEAGADPVKTALDNAVLEYSEAVEDGEALGEGEWAGKLYRLMVALFTKYTKISGECEATCPRSAAERLAKLANLELAAAALLRLRRSGREEAAELGRVIDEVFSV
nr:MAG: hypothetical protein TU35_09315 [Thermoproteus sp. AZ2]